MSLRYRSIIIKTPHALNRRTGHSVTWDTHSAPHDRLLVFGGGVLCHNDLLPTVRNFNDLYEWDMHTGECHLLCEHRNKRLVLHDDSSEDDFDRSISSEGSSSDQHPAAQSLPLSASCSGTRPLESWMHDMKIEHPCPRECHAAFMTRGGNLVVMAGQTGIRSRLMDMFIWHRTSNTWRRVEFHEPKHTSPFVRLVPIVQRRTRHSGLRLLDDDLIVVNVAEVEGRGRLPAREHGHNNGPPHGEGARGHLNRSHAPVWCQAPFPRENLACCYLEHRDALIVHGGWIGGSLRFDDLYLFSFSTRRWFTLPQWSHGSDAGSRVMCRVPASSHYCLPLTPTRIVFCGGTLHNIWEFSLTKYTWKRLLFHAHDATVPPSAQWVGRPMMMERKRQMLVFDSTLQPYLFRFDSLLCCKIDVHSFPGPAPAALEEDQRAQDDENENRGEEDNDEDDDDEPFVAWMALDRPEHDMAMSQRTGSIYLIDRQQDGTCKLHVYEWVSRGCDATQSALLQNQRDAHFTDVDIVFSMKRNVTSVPYAGRGHALKRQRP